MTLLLEKGAGIEARNGAGDTALMCAARNGYFSTVKLLLQKGANPHAGAEGVTPLRLAEAGEHKEIADLLRATAGE